MQIISVEFRFNLNLLMVKVQEVYAEKENWLLEVLLMSVFLCVVVGN